MYKLVKTILDKSRNADVDILVAADMVAAEDKESREAIIEARDLIKAHYDAIAKCRREDDEATIEKLCGLIAAGDKQTVKALEKEILEK